MYKNSAMQKRARILGRSLFVLKTFFAFCSVACLSFLLIFLHDLLTQASCLEIRNIAVEGCRRIPYSEVLQWGNLDKKTNILSLNIKALQRRLISHPWIKTADVRREVPDKIFIRISEYTPVAVVDCGQKFLLDDRGAIFKKVDHEEDIVVPIVTGLKISDFTIDGKNCSTPLQTVRAVIKLSMMDKSILPLHSINAIHVDTEIGLTVYAFDSNTTIKLGFGNYRSKFKRLEDMVPYLKTRQGLLHVRCVDLKDTRRVVVKTREVDPKEV